MAALPCPALAAEPAEALVLEYTEVPLYAGKRCLGTGILMGPTSFVPLRAFTEAVLGCSCNVSWDQETGTAVLTAPGLELRLRQGDGYMTANGRYLYLGDQTYNVNGSLLVPVRTLAKALGVAVEWDSENWSVHLDLSAAAPIASGDSFYKSEDVYWLSHVIYSESGNQPLEGMIGVGNVVLNRANDDSGLYGGDIRGVIFLPGQFDVVPTGAIYMEPSEKAVAAAKLALEGYNTVGDSKWFLNPAIGNSEWFRTYKTLAVRIADHDFYA